MTPAPASPESTVEAFLAAVRANDLARMGELWGDRRGPAVTYMPRAELQQRLTVMRVYLQHDRRELLSDNVGLTTGTTRAVRVRLFRRGCEPVVPFTLEPYRGGWLITNIDLGAAGNPERACR